MDKSYESSLVLEQLVFDDITFKRLGFQNEKEIEFSIHIQIVKHNQEENSYRISLILGANKEDEYSFTIGLTGYFRVEAQKGERKINTEELLKRNGVAILMPFLRSEATLLTSQPGMEPVVLPVFNINAMIDDAK
ncbi:MAG: protein-export chaperone SecB [Lachnospiraceae bacterium]|nr:protein-export chaperone SecB [Lachnospiraceae bacterium]